MKLWNVKFGRALVTLALVFGHVEVAFGPIVDVLQAIRDSLRASNDPAAERSLRDLNRRHGTATFMVDSSKFAIGPNGEVNWKENGGINDPIGTYSKPESSKGPAVLNRGHLEMLAEKSGLKVNSFYPELRTDGREFTNNTNKPQNPNANKRPLLSENPDFRPIQPPGCKWNDPEDSRGLGLQTTYGVNEYLEKNRQTAQRNNRTYTARPPRPNNLEKLKNDRLNQKKWEAAQKNSLKGTTKTRLKESVKALLPMIALMGLSYAADEGLLGKEVEDNAALANTNMSNALTEAEDNSMNENLPLWVRMAESYRTMQITEGSPM